MTDYIELSVKVPRCLEAPAAIKIARENPELTPGEVFAKMIRRLVGPWPDVTIVSDPSTVHCPTPGCLFWGSPFQVVEHLDSCIASEPRQRAEVTVTDPGDESDTHWCSL
jgi:hypothetical protein